MKIVFYNRLVLLVAFLQYSVGQVLLSTSDITEYYIQSLLLLLLFVITETPYKQRHYATVGFILLKSFIPFVVGLLSGLAPKKLRKYLNVLTAFIPLFVSVVLLISNVDSKKYYVSYWFLESFFWYLSIQLIESKMTENRSSGEDARFSQFSLFKRPERRDQ